MPDYQTLDVNGPEEPFTNPWARREQIGVLQALVTTARSTLLKPEKFFQGANPEDSIYESFLFFFIFTIIISAVMIGMVTLFPVLLPSDVPRGIFRLLANVLLGALIGPFVLAGFLHLGVLLVGGKEGFKPTFHVVAYSASANLFSLVPYIGRWIALIWGLVIVVSGLKRMQALSNGRALIAYFLPMALVTFVSFIVGIGEGYHEAAKMRAMKGHVVHVTATTPAR